MPKASANVSLESRETSATVAQPTSSTLATTAALLASVTKPVPSTTPRAATLSPVPVPARTTSRENDAESTSIELITVFSIIILRYKLMRVRFIGRI